MQRIDTDLISHDVVARVEYTQSFLNFDPCKDGALLNASKAHFTKQTLDDINGTMFDKMLQYDITRAPFARPRVPGRSDSGTDIADLSRQHPNIVHRQFFQHLLGAIFGNEDWSPTSPYWAHMDRVGHMHIGVGADVSGLPHRKNKPALIVHIREIGLMIGWMEDAVIEAVMCVDDKDLPLLQKSLVVRAWNKFWWLQADLFVKWQTLAPGDEKKEKDAATMTTTNGASYALT